MLSPAQELDCDEDFSKVVVIETSILQNEVQVWTVRLTESSDVTALFEVLTEDEKARADAFHSMRDRARYVVGRNLARMVAGRLLGIEPRAVTFELAGFGKPTIRRDGNAVDLRFNVSHSGDFVIAGFTLGRAIGIDIEQFSDFDFEEVAKRFFSPREQAELLSLPALEKRDAFFRCWCRKEAYVKAHGAGLSCPTALFDVSLRSGEAASLIATRPDPTEAARWTIRDLNVCRDYAAALAVEGTDFELKLSPSVGVEKIVDPA